MADKKNKKNFIFLLTALIIVLLDQLTKYLIKNQVIRINFITNTGSLFGLFKGSALFLIWLSIIVIGLFLYKYNEIQKSAKLVKLSCGLIVGGVIGNSIDRIAFGAVIDFIDLGFWPSFNIADSALSAGVILLIVYFFFKQE
ncbi:MAG: signal peptidase II [Nanoarchaeota archaeon]|nr:signal peptidase II [Nanoarchaeota archaeon]